MDHGLKRLEEKVLDEYLSLVQRVQPELDRRFFYDVMPDWEDFREYRMRELVRDCHPFLSFKIGGCTRS